MTGAAEELELVREIERALGLRDAEGFVRALHRLPPGFLDEKTIRTGCWPLLICALHWLRELATKGSGEATLFLGELLDEYHWLRTIASTSESERSTDSTQLSCNHSR
jgi:hypothetical protein